MSVDSASVKFVAKSSLSASLNAEAALSAQLGAGAAVVNDYLIRTEEIDGGHRLTSLPAAPSPVRATTPTLRARSAEALSRPAAQRPSAAARPGSAGTTFF